jgi:two-component system response regulator AtoC
MVASRDEAVRGIFASAVDSHDGCRAAQVDNGTDAVRHYQRERPAVVFLDVASPEDLVTLERFRHIDREIPIVAVSSRYSAASVVHAIRLGAADFLSAPFDAQLIDAALTNALWRRQIRCEMATLRREVQSQSKHTMLFGTGDAMAEVRATIDQVVDTDVSVLIRGETGTGKELVARALAASSVRRGAPFVKINCAALPGDLFEAELFGFERGAFTGALHAKPGKFEFANGGTIFLDEIGEIPLPLQSKLLQVLQDGRFWRVGASREIQAIVRVIAATNRDLDQAVLAKQFRQDLLFRLNVIPLWLPPLRDRRHDIPALAEFFAKRWAVFYNRRYAALSADMMEALLHYTWPGNIRELENVIQRTVILGEAAVRKTLAVPPVAAAMDRESAMVAATGGRGVEGSQPVPDAMGAPPSTIHEDERSLKRASQLAAREAEGAMIVRMLQQTQGNRKQAAINLGLSYKALLYKAKEHGW